MSSQRTAACFRAGCTWNSVVFPQRLQVTFRWLVSEVLVLETNESKALPREHHEIVVGEVVFPLCVILEVAPCDHAVARCATLLEGDASVRISVKVLRTAQTNE